MRQSKRNLWPFVGVVLFAVVYAFIFIIPEISTAMYDEDTASLLRQGKYNPFELSVKVAPNSLSEKSYQEITLRVTELSYTVGDPNAFDTSIATVCAGPLVILIRGEMYIEGYGYETHRFFMGDDKRCAELNLDSHSHFFLFNEGMEDLVRSSELLFLENGSFYFPYDGFTYQIIALLSYDFLDANEATIDSGIAIPYMTIENLGGVEWNIQLLDTDLGIAEYYQVLGDEYSDFAHNNLSPPPTVKYSRPLILRLAVPVLLISLLLITALLATLTDTGTFIEGAIGILFGLSGVREVIIPNDVSARTVIDIILIGLYGAFFLATFIQIVRFSIQFKEKQKTPLLVRKPNKASITKITPIRMNHRSSNPLTTETALRTLLVLGILLPIVRFFIERIVREKVPPVNLSNSKT